MNKIKGYFSSLKLSHKFTYLIIAIVVFPMVVLSSLFFQSIRESKINEKMKNVELNFIQANSQIQKNVEMCSMSTQVVLNSQNFWSYVERFKSEEQIDTHELIAFYKGEVNSIEKMVNSNPYLYQIRVYADLNDVPEMMPVLYRAERMNRLSWAKEGNYTSGSWQFDYDDELFPTFTAKSSEGTHVVSLVTEKLGSDGKVFATIEIATRMELLFPQIYSNTENEWTTFVASDGSYYSDKNYNSRWVNNIDTILETMSTGFDSATFKQMTLDGEQVFVCFKPIKELSGSLIKIVSLKDDINAVNMQQNVFASCFIVIVIALIFFSDLIVRIILRQFYSIMDTVRKVQKGDLEVRVPHCGSDEIGELGQQINKMLERITHLMDDSIKREILVKDSEIRALQNQINAHFIYNVLESIKMMAEVDEKYDISDAVTALGKLLRYSMKWVSKNVTVEDEIDYIKNYLALINLRFDYEIYLSLNIPEQIYSQEIPKMSLQPIIENAIYHGIEELAEDTNIYMKGTLYDTYCTIEITDAGRGMSDEQVDRLQKKIDGAIETTGSSGNGIGLKNVQDRIKISFGKDYGISIASKKDCYTKVIVKIPLL
jgi:two-component system, sensor histidine kinase YesM